MAGIDPLAHVRGTTTGGLVVLAILGLVVLAGCAPSPSLSPSANLHRPIGVMVSLPPQIELVQRVGGDRVTVMSLLKPNQSAHVVTIDVEQQQFLLRAALFVRNGHLPIEAVALERITEKNPALRIVDGSVGMSLLQETDHHHTDGSTHNHPPGEFSADPHTWLSPRRMRLQVFTIARALGEIDPSHAAEFHANAVRLAREIDDLDARISRLLAPLTRQGKPAFLVFHPSFAYFADDYGLRQIAIEVNGKVPNAFQLMQVMEAARTERINTIFVQRGFSTESVSAIVETLNRDPARTVPARVEVIDPLAPDWMANLWRIAQTLAVSIHAAPINMSPPPPHSVVAPEPDWANPFLQTALIGGLLACLACGLVGSLVVVRRIVFISDGIAHAAFGGLGVAYFAGYHVARATGEPLTPGAESAWLFFGALVAALVAALIMAAVKFFAHDREDSVIGILWALGMALGVLFLHLTPGYQPHLESFLFGDILLVSQRDLTWMVVLDGMLLVVVLTLFRRLQAVCFDEEFAAVVGLRVRGLHTLLLILVALTVVMLSRVVGIILVVALLTLPPSIAAHHTHQLWRMMVVATLVGAVCVTTGLGIAAVWNWPSGATIVLAAVALFIVSSGIRGLRRNT